MSKNIAEEYWERLKGRMVEERMETHRTSAIVAATMYAVSAAMTVNKCTAQDISELAFRIEQSGGTK